MLLRDVLNGIEIIKTNCDLNIEITSICHDSRKAQSGALFVAISGFQVDGNNYVKAAMDSGAIAVLTEKPSEDIPYVQVANARSALAASASNFQKHPAREMKIIGVTGTNGKTTVTYLLKQVLEATGAKVGLIGTNQNMIGDEVIETERTTPEPNGLQELLRRMADAGCSHVVMEVSSHSLVLDRVYGIEFEVGIFTNVTQDHLDFHKTMQAYTEAKALLFAQCKKGVINLDDAASEVMMESGKCEYITYSAKRNSADIVAKNIKLKERMVSFEVLCQREISHIDLGIPGEFSVYNALAVISSAHAIGIPMEIIASALKTAHGVCGRVEVVPCDTDYTVMIDYAHTPDGLENVLKAIKGFVKGRIITVFGCGGNRDARKRPIMGKIATELSDFTIITSDNPRNEEPMAIIEDILGGIKNKKTYHVEPSRYDAIHYALSIAESGDVVLLAGKGHETYQEICGVRNHMDEREIVAEYFVGRE